MPKPTAKSPSEASSTGSKLVAKYRARMSTLTDEERQRLMARGLQIVYGDTPQPKRAARG